MSFGNTVNAVHVHLCDWNQVEPLDSDPGGLYPAKLMIRDRNANPVANILVHHDALPKLAAYLVGLANEVVALGRARRRAANSPNTHIMSGNGTALKPDETVYSCHEHRLSWIAKTGDETYCPVCREENGDSVVPQTRVPE